MVRGELLNLEMIKEMSVFLRFTDRDYVNSPCFLKLNPIISTKIQNDSSLNCFVIPLYVNFFCMPLYTHVKSEVK